MDLFKVIHYSFSSGESFLDENGGQNELYRFKGTKSNPMNGSEG